MKIFKFAMAGLFLSFTLKAQAETILTIGKITYPECVSDIQSQLPGITEGADREIVTYAQTEARGEVGRFNVNVTFRGGWKQQYVVFTRFIWEDGRKFCSVTNTIYPESALSKAL